MSKMPLRRTAFACLLLILNLHGTAEVFAQDNFPATECENRPGRPAETSAEATTISRLAPLRQCKTAIDDRTACNVFLGRALKIIFDNTDFAIAPDRFMLANDIVNGLEVHGNAGWQKIGVATDQAALDRAQELANQGKPVVAARVGALKQDGTRGPGHVALIIPGTTEKFSFDGFSWGPLRAPSSASFFLDKPDRFFAGCPLSAVWRKPNDVGLYSKP